MSPTGCHGWLAAHLLIHVRLDAAELLACFTEPADDPADRDFVSYWRDRDDLTYVGKATGRLPLDAKEKLVLGRVIPVFG